MAKASDNQYPSVLFAEQASDPATPGAGLWRAFFKAGGLYVIDDAGAVTGPFGAATAAGLATDFAERTAGALTLNSTTWADVDTSIDLTVAASTGDVIEVCLSAFWGAQAVNGCLDAATIVSGSPVNYIGCGGGASDLGVQGWLGAASASESVGGGVMYAVQAGDISTGNVTVRLRYRTTAATNKTLNASATQPLQWSLKNLG